MKQLDQKAVWLFFISFALRWLMIIFILLGFAFPKVILSGSLRGVWDWKTTTILVTALVLSYIWAKLTYHFYRYELTDDGFRKELGVIWKKYVTIPYNRIQNVDIYRGPVARILGLSDLHIQTAGASTAVSRYGTTGIGAEGRLPGLSQEAAEQLRNELIKRAGSLKNQEL